MKDIAAIALDVDGVLTDGGVWWGPNGQEWKRFSYADIMGVSLGIRAGLVFALISGEESELVDRFAAKFGIQAVEKGCRDKGAALRRFSASSAIPLAAIAFMGDDINDLGAMQLAGLPAVPAGAHQAAKRCAAFVSRRRGGHGAVRELIDAVLAAKALDAQA